MMVGDVVDIWGGHGAGLVLKIKVSPYGGHPCHGSSSVTVLKPSGETDIIKASGLRVISTTYNPYTSGNKKTK